MSLIARQEHRGLTQEQMAAFALFRSGAGITLRHTPCDCRTPLGREATIDELLDVAMDHIDTCAAVPR